MSDQVSRPFLASRVDACGVLANDAVSRMPQLGPTLALNGTGTPCVSSHTVSIAPAAPHTTWKSAARATVAVAPSRMRPGELGVCRYECTPAIVTPAICPAVLVMSGTFVVLAHAPAAGVQLPPTGSTVFSLAAPAHQRGPLRAEFSGMRSEEHTSELQSRENLV